jgi:hypothetical protein
MGTEIQHYLKDITTNGSLMPSRNDNSAYGSYMIGFTKKQGLFIEYEVVLGEGYKW